MRRISLPIALIACFFSPIGAVAQTWTQLSPSGTPPVARSATTGVYDSAHNLMIVFGGRDTNGNNLNDVWVLTNANGAGSHPIQWINLIPNGAAGSPPARSGHSAVYDSANNRIIIFGGCSANCAPVLNDVWVLANANGIGGTPAWTQLSPGAGPEPRTNAAVAYDPVDNELIVVGGQDGSANPCSTFSDVWVLASPNGLPATGNWMEPFIFSPVPGAGQNGVAGAFVSNALFSKEILLFGGTGMLNGTCTATNTTWAILAPFNIGYADELPQSVTPPARSFASMVFDTSSGQSLLFGGLDASGNYLSDVWDYFGGWTQIAAKSTSPAARSGHAAVLDSTNQRMIVFGGSNAGGVRNDTWVFTAPGVSGLSCSANGVLAGIIAAQGIAEQMADMVLNCTGGTPTPQGQPIPEYWVTLTLNTDVTSRLLSQTTGLSEALMLIDDPFPAKPIPSSEQGFLSPTPQILCTPPGSYCAATGTGGTPSPYQTQANVFVGKQNGASTLYWKVPIDPPGPNSTRRIRITNVRANAALFGVPPTFQFPQVQATVAIQGSPSVEQASTQQLVGIGAIGIAASVISTGSIPQCEPHNAALLGGSGAAAFDFSMQAQEEYSYAFRNRNYGANLFGTDPIPPLAEQNVPGYFYGTQTGFFSPSLFTTATGIGLGFFGTRILVMLGPVSAGTKLFVPTTITMAGNYEGAPAGQLQLIQANQYGDSAPGYQPVPSTAMIGAIPVAEAYSSGSLAYATYEVTYADIHVLETATIPVAVAFTNTPSIGTVQFVSTLAPLSSTETTSLTAPIPRFANFAIPEPAYTINSCSAP